MTTQLIRSYEVVIGLEIQLLLNVAHRLQQATDFHSRKPEGI